MKRLFSIVWIAVLAAALALVPCAGAAEVNGQTVIFTVVNNTLAPLRSDTMPFISDGMLYVPYTVFTENFGVVSIYNSRDNLLILSNEDKTLFFNTVDGGCYDRDGKTYAYNTSSYNGQAYVPAVFVSSVFNLLCGYYPNSSVVRIKDITSSYSDTYLISMLQAEMDAALEVFQEEMAREQEPEFVPFDVYFCFSGALGESTGYVLDALAAEGIKAAFFVTAEDILANEALVRRIYVEGHTLGLTLSQALTQDVEAMTAAFDLANETFDRVLNQKTRLVMIPGGSNVETFTQAHRNALRENGYRYWDNMLSPDAIRENTGAARVVNDICDKLLGVSATTVIGFGYETQAAQALSGIHAFLEEHGCTIRSIHELASPVNFHADLW